MIKTNIFLPYRTTTGPINILLRVLLYLEGFEALTVPVLSSHYDISEGWR